MTIPIHNTEPTTKAFVQYPVGYLDRDIKKRLEEYYERKLWWDEYFDKMRMQFQRQRYEALAKLGGQP